ncbi:MAG: RAMP superfamily CRISPR-associated protein [archaeon GBS-70-058]|nr:RAMP superfamily CRISPR-associated protein [Candidatus Culexarchaeum nevadense]
MQQARLNVLRSSPRDRGVYRDLCGLMDVSLFPDNSYLHVGSGREVFEVDLKRLKEVYGRRRRIDESVIRELRLKTGYSEFASTAMGVVIPGSTVKGNVRARLELSFHGFNGKVRSCFLRASRIVKVEKGGSGWRHQRVWSETVFEDRGPPCDYTRMDNVCLICDLFGTAGLKSLIEFSDFIGSNVKLEALDLPYGMKVYAAPPGSEFNGEISFMNLKDYELGLLLLGMGVMNGSFGRSVILGRFKYRGLMDNKKFGIVKYKVNRISLNRYSSKLVINDLTINPGDHIEGEKLDTLCKVLANLSLKHFENEFRIVDEVEILEKL